MQPTIELTWEAVGVLTAIVSLISIGLGLYVRLSVRAALADFREEFFRTLNGRYVYSKLCEERHGETQRRLQVIEER
ncbi:MAG: hypothetical protein ABFD89_00740 [Bryobacteraceae bacterium]